MFGFFAMVGARFLLGRAIRQKWGWRGAALWQAYNNRKRRYRNRPDWRKGHKAKLGRRFRRRGR